MTLPNKTIVFLSHSPSREEALFAWTLQLAQRLQARVLVLTVLPEIKMGVLEWVKNVLPSELIEKQTAVVLAQQSHWHDLARSANVDLNLMVDFGKEFYKAIQVVVKHQACWLIKLADEDDSSLTTLFSSQDMHLLRKCPCALLLHKTGSVLPFERVMVALDVDVDEYLDSPTRHKNALSQTLLQQALLVSGVAVETPHPPQPLSIAHAWRADAEDLMRSWNSDLTDEDLMRYREHIRAQHHGALEYELADIRQQMPNLNVYLASGTAQEVIPDLVSQQHIDLLVMGTLSRSGLPGLLIGNTAENILEKVHCSVLALKPEGFVSPVLP
jgi:nucleotide-binding universal stress UspA family protein